MNQQDNQTTEDQNVATLEERLREEMKWANLSEHMGDAYDTLIKDILALFSQELSIVEKKAYERSAEIVRTHPLMDWSGEEEVYEELEQIALNIDTLSKEGGK